MPTKKSESTPEAPKQEAPKAEAPKKVETPKVEPPKVEEPKEDTSANAVVSHLSPSSPTNPEVIETVTRKGNTITTSKG